MGLKKTFDILDLLQKLAAGQEIVISDYAIQNEISPRTVRRYFEDLREFFGEHSIIQTSRGSYTSLDKNILNSIMLPTLEEKLEIQKMVDLLHIINPGFTKILPPEYRKVNKKLEKELTQVFLIKGSPSEKFLDEKIFEILKKAIKGRRYCKITYKNEQLRNIKPLKMIYSKGNWSLAFLNNSVLKVIRICFIKDIEIDSKTFNKDLEAEKFINITQVPLLDIYKKESFKVEVAISPEIKEYFFQKCFLQNQKILETLENGWTKVSYEVTSDEIIIMLCRRWFPNMIVLNPKRINRKIDFQINKYQENIKSFKFEE